MEGQCQTSKKRVRKDLNSLNHMIVIVKNRLINERVQI